MTSSASLTASEPFTLRTDTSVLSEAEVQRYADWIFNLPGNLAAGMIGATFPYRADDGGIALRRFDKSE